MQYTQPALLLLLKKGVLFKLVRLIAYCQLRVTLRVFILLLTRIIYKRRLFLFFFLWPYLLCVGKVCKKRTDCVDTSCVQTPENR